MRKTDFTLPKLDDLFSTQEMRDDAKLERVQNIPLSELHPFKDHPCKVQNNEEMERMKVSARLEQSPRRLQDRCLTAAMSLSPDTDGLRRVRCSELKLCRSSSVRCPTTKR